MWLPTLAVMQESKNGCRENQSRRLFKSMKKSFTVSVWQEKKIYVAQCLEVDVASQGGTEEEALSNLQEALELHFEDPVATVLPEIKKVQAEVGAA
uniref:HicB family protein n=2 Tax=Leptospira santarosai TaxID=28183 RepID=M6JQF3_9LEPT|nr:hypothetical protein LEP1GSC063_3246 [Leptospira santarosai serovar Arenal str. MAVJ 401]